jgi:mannose-6-phosphate isomerase-like protein (cupin superfamily)
VDQPEVVPIAYGPNWAKTRFGLAETELDMRILRGVLGCEHVGVSYLRFGPDWRPTIGHRHPAGGEEVYVLVEGRAEIKVGERIMPMAAPAAIRVPSEELRGIRAAGEESAVFVVVGYPIDDPDETEIVPGFWPRD